VRECNVVGCEARAVCSTESEIWWCAEHFDGYTDARQCDPDYSVLVNYEQDWQ